MPETEIEQPEPVLVSFDSPIITERRTVQARSNKPIPVIYAADQWALLSGLRFVLAIIVLIGHSPLISNLSGFWKLFVPEDAVLGFFLISGYSIAASIERESSFYLMRRAKRILPIYYVGLFLGLIVWKIAGSSIQTTEWGAIGASKWTAFAGSLLLLQGFLTGVFNYNGPTWSLSLECCYYLFAPKLKKLSMLLLIGLMEASIAGFIFHASSGRLPYDHEKWGVGMFCLLWAWLLGFLLYVHKESLWMNLFALVLPIAVTAFDPDFAHGLGPLILLSCSIVLIRARTQKVPVICTKTLLHLGDLSYPLYLVHYPIFLLFAVIIHRHGQASISILPAAIVSLIVAEIAYWLVDWPIRKRKTNPSH